MKAPSLRQSRANAIMRSGKPIESRSGPPRVRAGGMSRVEGWRGLPGPAMHFFMGPRLFYSN
jgi:hypothetical protein